MLENAVRFCEARFAQLFLYSQEAKQFLVVATLDLPPAWAEYLGETPIPASPLVPLGRAAMTKRPVHIEDIRTDRAYIEGFAPLVKLVELGGARTLLVMPMLKENTLVGAIGIHPTRSSSVRKQTNRISSKLRRTSCDRHRECSLA